MNGQPITGHVDQNHQLSAAVPDSIPPGPVTVIVISASDEDEAGNLWQAAVVQQWHDDLADERQDIYSLTDGAPVDES